MGVPWIFILESILSQLPVDHTRLLPGIFLQVAHIEDGTTEGVWEVLEKMTLQDIAGLLVTLCLVSGELE